MPWNTSTKIMTAPLNINSSGDIQKATGYNSGDLGDCIVNGTINKWAKYKPVKSSSLIPLTEAELKAMNYGLTITKYTSMGSTSSGLMKAIIDKSGWAYNQPDGSSGDVYRLYDFTKPGAITSTGYRGDADCFLSSVDSADIYIQGTSGQAGLPFTANWNKSTNLKEGSIAIGDLTDVNGDNINISNMYFAVLMVRDSSYVFKTSSATIGDANYTTEVVIPPSTIDGLATGVWYLYFFVTYTQSTSIVTNAGSINNVLSQGAYTLPDVGRRSLTIRSSATLASASIANSDAHPIVISVGAGRLSASFYISYKASNSNTYIYPTYKIYGGATPGAKTTLYWTGTYTLRATTTLQFQSVTTSERQGTTPNYLTFELTYTVGSSVIVYTTEDISIPVNL